jgi:hypothetical protein
MEKPHFNRQASLFCPFETWRFLFSRGNFFVFGRTFFRKNLPFFLGLLRSPKFLIAGLVHFLFLFGSILSAQTVVLAGLGPMSSTQPDRETAFYPVTFSAPAGRTPGSRSSGGTRTERFPVRAGTIPW